MTTTIEVKKSVVEMDGGRTGIVHSATFDPPISGINRVYATDFLELVGACAGYIMEYTPGNYRVRHDECGPRMRLVEDVSGR